MKKSYAIYFKCVKGQIARTILMFFIGISSMMFFACENFLDGSELKESFDKEIVYANAEELNTAVITDNIYSGRIYPSDEVKKVGIPFTVQFELNSTYGYFDEWRAVQNYNTENATVVSDELIQFDDKKSVSTTVTFNKALKDVTIVAFCKPFSEISIVQTVDGENISLNKNYLSNVKIIKFSDNGNPFYDISANIDSVCAISGIKVIGTTFSSQNVELTCDTPEKNIVSLVNERLSFADGGVVLNQLENKMAISCVVHIDVEKLKLVNKDGFKSFSIQLDFTKRPEVIRTIPASYQSQDRNASTYIFFSEPMDWSSISTRTDLQKGDSIYEDSLWATETDEYGDSYTIWSPHKDDYLRYENDEPVIKLTGERNGYYDNQDYLKFIEKIRYIDDYTLKIEPKADYYSSLENIRLTAFPINARIQLAFSENVRSQKGIPFGTEKDFVWYTNVYTDSSAPVCNVHTEKFGPDYYLRTSLTSGSGRGDRYFHSVENFHYRALKSIKGFNSFVEWKDYLIGLSKTPVSLGRDEDIYNLVTNTQYINKKFNRDYFEQNNIDVSNINKSEKADAYDLCLVFDGVDDAGGSGIDRYEIFQVVYDPNNNSEEYKPGSYLNAFAEAIDNSWDLDPGAAWYDNFSDFANGSWVITADELLKDNRFYLNPVIPDYISEDTKSVLVLFVIFCYDRVGNFSYIDQWVMCDLDQENRMDKQGDIWYESKTGEKNQWILGM